jgi:mono/diheme cytochrome c family protein
LTEIPEHLLKRSKERRAALGLPGGEGGDAGSGGDEAKAADAPAAPAKAAAPAPAKVEAKPPPPPKPKPAYNRAAEGRKRIPYWAMPVIALLPLWAFLYQESVTVPEQGDEAIAHGEEVYGACAGCHLANGAGGTGAKLNEGEVLKTFPDPVGMMEWIHLGADGWVGASRGPYGDPNREGGPHDAGDLTTEMPGFPELTAEDLAAVTRYIREELSGEVPTPEAAELYEEWAEMAIENAEEGTVLYRDTQPDAESEERVAAVGGGG